MRLPLSTTADCLPGDFISSKSKWPPFRCDKSRRRRNYRNYTKRAFPVATAWTTLGYGVVDPRGKWVGFIFVEISHEDPWLSEDQIYCIMFKLNDSSLWEECAKPSHSLLLSHKQSHVQYSISVRPGTILVFSIALDLSYILAVVKKNFNSKPSGSSIAKFR